MPELTADLARELFNYDPITGILAWKKQPSKRYKTSLVAGYRTFQGYLKVTVARRIYSVHRIAWLISYGCWPTYQIDHINGAKDDNRLVNLRDVTPKINMENMRKAKARSSTGLLGVSWSKPLQKYKAAIHFGGKNVHLGYYANPDEAHHAYVTAKRQLHAGCTI